MPTPHSFTLQHPLAVPLRSDEDLFDQSKMSFGEHLDELRTALWKCVVALVLGTVVGFFLGKPVLHAIQGPLQEGLDKLRTSQARQATGEEPLDVDGRSFIPIEIYEREGGQLRKRLLFTPLDQDPRTQAIGTGVPDALMVYMKASLVVGVVVSSPALFYFIWSFVASGLYSHERAYVYTFMPFSLALFLLGAAVAFFFAVKLVVDFLFTFYDWLGFAPMPRINEWLSFVLMLPLGFGVAFQLPLVMLFLERIGVFTVTTYQGSWKVAILVICVLSMILTPQDPGSMLLLAVPLVVLYFGGIALCRFLPRRGTPLGGPVEDSP